MAAFSVLVICHACKHDVLNGYQQQSSGYSRKHTQSVIYYYLLFIYCDVVVVVLFLVVVLNFHFEQRAAVTRQN